MQMFVCFSSPGIPGTPGTVDTVTSSTTRSSRPPNEIADPSPDCPTAEVEDSGGNKELVEPFSGILVIPEEEEDDDEEKKKTTPTPAVPKKSPEANKAKGNSSRSSEQEKSKTTKWPGGAAGGSAAPASSAKMSPSLSQEDKSLEKLDAVLRREGCYETEVNGFNMKKKPPFFKECQKTFVCRTV